MQLHIEPVTHIKPLQGGSCILPPSKSQTMRALVFAALSRGTSTISSYLHSPDTDAMIQALKTLGIAINKELSTITVEGQGGHFQPPCGVIDSHNSGLVLRFIAALAALTPNYTLITGDASIQERRAVSPLIDGLTSLGVHVLSLKNNQRPPLIIKGPFLSNQAHLEGYDSQPVSALLIASAFSPHLRTQIEVTHPGETPWIDLTLAWLNRFQIPYENQSYERYSVTGRAVIAPFAYRVPGDLSTLAFLLALSFLTPSKHLIEIENVDLSDPQGDKKIIDILHSIGIETHYDPERHRLSTSYTPHFKGMEVDLNPIIDALPILAVIACFAQTPSRLYNATVARYKESDRIACMAQELRKMGGCIEEHPDGLTIYPRHLHGALLDTHHDHRIALALSVGALNASSPSVIQNSHCMAKTFPDFVQTLHRLGGIVCL